MLTIHNDPAIKAHYLARVEAHRLADEVVQGVYYETLGGKTRACAIGCTIHGSEREAYTSELGIPMWLARVEESVHEGLSPEDCKSWPSEFLAAVPVGVDLGPLRARYFVWLLDNFTQTEPDEALAKAVLRVRVLWGRIRDGGEVHEREWAEAVRPSRDTTLVSGHWPSTWRFAHAVAENDVTFATWNAYPQVPGARRAFYGRLREWLLAELRALAPSPANDPS